MIAFNSQKSFFLTRYSHAAVGPIRYQFKRVELFYSWACLSILGFAVQRLPTHVLILVLFPPAFIKTTIELFIRRHTATSYEKLKLGLTQATPAVPLLKLFCVRLRLNINRTMTFSCGQIRSSRWQARIEYRGFNKLLHDIKSGRSVLLASVHYGSPRDASIIIRSQGLHLSSLAHHPLTPLEQRAWETRNKLWGLQTVPYIFHPADMWETRDFLREPGNLVLMLIESENNARHMTGAFIGGQIRAAKGFMKFAEMSNAVVVPVACTSTGLLRWRLWFGNGMEYDGNEVEATTFLQQTMQQLETEVVAHPEQIHPELIRAFIREDGTDLDQQ